MSTNTITVKVVRGFYYQGKPIKVGEVASLPRVFALEMLAAHKAVKHKEKTQEAPPPQDKQDKQKKGGSENAK